MLIWVVRIIDFFCIVHMQLKISVCTDFSIVWMLVVERYMAEVLRCPNLRSPVSAPIRGGGRLKAATWLGGWCCCWWGWWSVFKLTPCSFRLRCVFWGASAGLSTPPNSFFFFLRKKSGFATKAGTAWCKKQKPLHSLQQHDAPDCVAAFLLLLWARTWVLKLPWNLRTSSILC